MKILPTAGFSTLFLHRKLSPRQVVSLPLLAVGVSCVHISNRGIESGEEGRHSREWWLGLVAAVCAAVLSGCDKCPIISMTFRFQDVSVPALFLLR